MQKFQMRKLVNIVFEYVRARRSFLCMAALWGLLFSLCFFLSGISGKYIWYPLLLCMALSGIYGIWGCWKFYKKHCRLSQIQNHVDVTLEHLPENANLLEEDYQNLLQELFMQKNAKLAEYNKTQDANMEYLTLWTHQIKTPLAAMQLTASELEEPVRAEFLTRIFEIEQYVDMMLQYLRLEGKGTDYVLKEYSLEAVVRQAVKYFARLFISKGISVNIDIPEGLMVVTDEKWLLFVMKQLVSNALKYTQKGQIQIYWKQECLWIQDTGIGIAEEDLPRIFERGYTGYNGRKDKKATGIGLYLSGLILNNLNHVVTVTSEVGKGTLVQIRFQGEGE